MTAFVLTALAECQCSGAVSVQLFNVWIPSQPLQRFLYICGKRIYLKDEYRSRYLTRTNTEIRIRPVAMQKKQTPPKTEFVVQLFLLLFLFLSIRRMCLTMRSLSKYFQLLWASFLHSRELFAIITGVNNTTTLENTSMSVFTFHFWSTNSARSI